MAECYYDELCWLSIKDIHVPKLLPPYKICLQYTRTYSGLARVRGKEGAKRIAFKPNHKLSLMSRVVFSSVKKLKNEESLSTEGI